MDGSPRIFPAPHPEAVGSLGDVAIEGIEARVAEDDRSRLKSGLRWWQWLTLQRLLEHRADGSPCWRVSLISVARQLGKTELLCELSTWACSRPDLFGGEPIEAGHCSNSVVLSKKVQSTRWPWATAHGLEIVRNAGDSALIWGDGSTWRTMSRENTYGRSLDLLTADEAWSWTSDDFWLATFPTLAERPHARAVMLSTAHVRPKSLVPGLLEMRGDVAVMLWGASPEDDQQDPATWRRASAFWSPNRERDMRMASGQASFATQWLNIWPSGDEVIASQANLVDAERFEQLRDRTLMVPRDRPVVAAMEAILGHPPAIGVAWRADDGRACVVGFTASSLAASWQALGDLPDGTLRLVGSSWSSWAMAKNLGCLPIGNKETPAALQGIAEQVASGVLRWDGDPLLKQVTSMRVVNSGTGRVSTVAPEQSHVVRAAAWALLMLNESDPERALAW